MLLNIRKNVMIKKQVGDVFLISFKNKFLVGKILWISKRTRNVFSFILYKNIYDTENININKLDETTMKIKLFTGLEEVFYTSKKIFEDKSWKIIGNKVLNENESTNLQYHNIGGNLYKGDEYIKVLTKDELKIYPKMLSAGYEAIYNYFEIMYKDNI
jgi:hypothetical protein